MLFPSEEFLFAFLPTVIVVYYILFGRNVVLKNIWLFLCSLFFYAWGEPKYVFLMLGVILFDYCMGVIIDKIDSRENSGISKNKLYRKCILILTAIVNIGILGWFKYSIFLENEILRLSGKHIVLSSAFLRELGMPIGISFFTFQAMSYVFDVYNGTVKAERNPIYVGLYVSFFPQLIAGPIVRYETVANQMRQRKESLEKIAEGIFRFLKGLIKKVIIANNMALVADAVWELVIGDRLEASVILAWLGAISYTLQIYFDFSGYSDMAIGLGKIFGFEFLENFNHPYTAKSVTEFWRRWHISLSSWFRDYVYIPLGGSRKGFPRTIRNLFFVWLLTGIWHGANWTFIIWGLLYFVVLAVEKVLSGIIKTKQSKEYVNYNSQVTGDISNDPGKYKPQMMSDISNNSGEYNRQMAVQRTIINILGHIYTLFIVILAWVIFRSDSLSEAIIYIRGMFGAGNTMFMDKAVIAYLKQNVFYYVLAIIGCMPIFGMLEQRLADRNDIWGKVYNICMVAFIGIGTIVAISFIINKAYSPFIYFNF